MRVWEYSLLFLFGLAVTLGIAAFQPAPGYMDADYYYAGGIQLASGKGLSEPFIWNYLDDPKSLPHPAFVYWMPLASLLAALGMRLTGEFDYFSARLVFIFLAAFIPPLTAWLSFRLSARRIAAWTAGGLAVFPGFYAVYLGLTETFTIYMLLGTFFLVAAASCLPCKGSGLPSFGKAVVLGLLAGLMHLARADGILWLVLGVFAILSVNQSRPIRQNWYWMINSMGLLVVTYLLVMAFWYGRNMAVFGSLFPPGNSRVLWLLDYDQLYNFLPAGLNAQTWATAGFGALLTQRWDALISNLQTMA
ncbi:MAG: hypothetical protein Q7U74_03045, partial [Saprospiraceae bacterium]|nr:hypothetical protein [Saprospiraceae bacterium]